MQKLSLIVLLLSCIGLSIASNCAVKTYRTKLVPACDINDLRIKWPNHEDQTTYHTCQSVGSPLLVHCPAHQVFSYVLQACSTCDRYIAPVECERLPTQKPPVCVAVNGSSNGSTTSPSPPSSSYPTPHYPSSTTAGGEEEKESTKTESTTTTDIPNNNTSTTTLEPNYTTQTEQSSGETEQPTPSSPHSTNTPSVPTPTRPIPTPPVIYPTPPLIG